MLKAKVVSSMQGVADALRRGTLPQVTSLLSYELAAVEEFDELAMSSLGSMSGLDTLSLPAPALGVSEPPAAQATLRLVTKWLATGPDVNYVTHSTAVSRLQRELRTLKDQMQVLQSGRSRSPIQRRPTSPRVPPSRESERPFGSPFAGMRPSPRSGVVGIPPSPRERTTSPGIEGFAASITASPPANRRSISTPPMAYADASQLLNICKQLHGMYCHDSILATTSPRHGLSITCGQCEAAILLNPRQHLAAIRPGTPLQPLVWTSICIDFDNAHLL